MRVLKSLAWLAAGTLACGPALAADLLHPSILDKLAGDWVAQGPVMGMQTCEAVHGAWVLGGTFLELTLTSRHPAHPYDANLYIGADGAGLTAHWLDQFGGSPAKTLGAGGLVPAGVTLDFPYPDNPFHDSLIYDAPHDRWHWLITAGAAPKTSVFSDWVLTRPGAGSCGQPLGDKA